MEKYSTKRAGCVRKIETLGGDYALKWDDETQMSVNAYAALVTDLGMDARTSCLCTAGAATARTSSTR